MDTLDVHILRMLYQGYPLYPLRLGIKLPQRNLGRKLGVSEGTIRNRIGKMRASGILKGSSVFVNPTLLSLSMGAYGLDVSSALIKKEVIDKLKLIDGVFGIQNHHGSFVGILFEFEPDNLSKRLDLFKKIADSDHGIFSQIIFPPSKISLGERDWSLIQFLTSRSLQNYEKLAGEVGLSSRTLKKRISGWLDSAVLFSLPSVSLGAVKNGVPADLIVTYKSRPEAEDRILELIDEFAFYTGTALESFGLYDLILPNAATATEILETIRQIDGVNDARIEFVDDHLDQPEVLSKYVERYTGIMNFKLKRP